MEIDNRQVRVLLVDDTPLNLEIAGKILEQEHYDIYIADSGASAIELAGGTNFDLILLDIMMPEMDGFETYDRIRQIENCRDIPIIFITAVADVDSVVKGFAMGAVDYIRKPFNILELKARIKNQVELKMIRQELEQKNKILQEAYRQLQVIAATDPLTQLLNRREIMQRLEYEQSRFELSKSPFSIIIGDIDYFKKINDTYGHYFGDYVLTTVSDLMRENIRKEDSAARWGGEEFLLLLPDTDTPGAVVVAEKIRNKIKTETFSLYGAETSVTMTFGISTYKMPQNIDLLIVKADNALYAGKQQGRDCILHIN